MQGEKLYPEATEIVINSTYVDDIIDSVESVEEASKITNGICHLLEPGNFHIKGWDISGQPQPSINLCDSVSIKVLGVSWEPEMDTIRFNSKLDFSRFSKVGTNDFELREGNSTHKIPKLLSKRLIMSQLNGIYDPLGLLVPFTIKGKLLVRNLWAKNYNWDTPLSDEEYSRWIIFFKEMLQVRYLYSPRSIKSSTTLNKSSILVTFSDASKEAFGCSSYIRWQLMDGSFQSHLIASKSRVAPLKTTTIVRLELSAVVLAKRLRLFIVDSFRVTFERTIHIIDSQIVKAMINKDSYGFNTFVSSRVGEIQAKTDPNDWYWVESKLNVADIISRDTSIPGLNYGSRWKIGPEFLKLPIDD